MPTSSWGVLVLVLCACAAPALEPLHEFPSRAQLQQLARRERLRVQPAGDGLSPPDWPLELPALTKSPGLPLIAVIAPTAKHEPALDCVAHELGRFRLQFPEQRPSRRLSQFLAARCGASDPLPLFVSWTHSVETVADDAALVAIVRDRIRRPLTSKIRTAGVAIVRDPRSAVLVVVAGAPDVELEP